MPLSSGSLREQLSGFPIWQMVIICIIRFSEPVAFTSLFPYVYFMIRDFEIAEHEEDISKYSGYLASSFAFAQFLCAVQWGRLGDKKWAQAYPPFRLGGHLDIFNTFRVLKKLLHGVGGTVIGRGVEWKCCSFANHDWRDCH